MLDLIHPSWDFNIIEYNDIVNNQVLTSLLINAVTQNHLQKRFNIPSKVLCNFANVVQDGYKDTNPYHNAIHGASVLYDMNWFISQDGVRNRLSTLELLAAILSAAVHGKKYIISSVKYDI